MTQPPHALGPQPGAVAALPRRGRPHPRHLLGRLAHRSRLPAAHRSTGRRAPRLHLQTNFLDPDGYEPKIRARHSTHASGRLGLQVYNGPASFDAIDVDDTTYTSGVLGFDVFGGLAAYQDAYATPPTTAGS